MESPEDSQHEDEDEYIHGAFALHVAVCRGNDDELLNLINEGHNVNSPNDWDETPVFLAAMYGLTETLKLLLNHGADPNQPCTLNEISPLLRAILGSTVHEECVQVLLENNADTDLGDFTGWSPLHQACCKGSSTLVERLIMSEAFINVQTKDGLTPLYSACECGQADCVVVLLKWGADPDIFTNEGDSPLLIACQENHDDCVELLLSHGVNVNHCNDFGYSALAMACERDHYKCAKLLIDAGADLVPHSLEENVESPLHLAVLCQSEMSLGLLIDSNVDVNHLSDGVTPLFDAARADNANGCQLLLSNGANPNCKCTLNVGTFTPLMIAARENNVDVVAELVSSGADVNLATFTSPLILAVQARSFESINFLLCCDVDVNYVDCDLHTALSHCLKHLIFGVSVFNVSVVDTCRNLLKSGADISRLFEANFVPPLLDVELILSYHEVMKLILEFDTSRNLTRELCEMHCGDKDWKPLCELVKAPRKLEHQCRVVIRRSLGCRRLKLIEELPLPNPLKSYLKHETVMELPFCSDLNSPRPSVRST